MVTLAGHTSGSPVSWYVPGARHPFPVSVGAQATAVPAPSIGGPAGMLAAALGPTLGEMVGPGLSAGVVDGPAPPTSVDRLLRRTAPRIAATTNVAATSPTRAPDELFDSIVNNLSGPGR